MNSKTSEHDLLTVGSFDFPVAIDPSKTALLVIDVQYGYAHADHGMAKAVAAAGTEVEQENTRDYLSRLESIVLPNIRRLLDFFRAHGLKVIFITVGTETEDLSDLVPTLRARHLERYERSGYWCITRKGTREHEILEAVKPRDDELVINKLGQSAFVSSNLDYILRNMGVDFLVITGIVTSGCVLATAIGAADRGYATVLVDDGCASVQPGSHEAAVHVFRSDFGPVASTERIILELERQFTFHGAESDARRSGTFAS